MGPTFETAYRVPLISDEIDEITAVERIVEPVRGFMLAQVREKDLAMFLELCRRDAARVSRRTPFVALVPAFMISGLAFSCF